MSTPSFDAIADFVPLTLLMLTFQANSVDHLNAQTASDLAPVAARYRWLMSVTAPVVGEPPAGQSTTLAADDLAARRALNASAAVELKRMASGLDYYGDTFNWVPVLSMTMLQNRISGLLADGKLIEDTYLAYQAHDADIAAKLAALDGARQHASDTIAADQDAITNLSTQIDAALASMASTLDAVHAQRNRLVATEFEFKEELVSYVIGQATGCTFLHVLEAIGMIVEFAAEAVVGVGEIGVLADAAELTAVAESVVKIIKVVDAEIEAIQSAVESVQSVVAKAEDAAKLVIDTDQFDTFIAQYLGKFPAAQELADAVHALPRPGQGAQRRGHRIRRAIRAA